MIRAAIKLVGWLGIAWVIAAQWDAVREAAASWATAVVEALGASAPMANLLALITALAAGYALLIAAHVLPVPLDRHSGPVRHPFPPQQLRIRLRIRRGRFLPSVLLLALGLVLAVRLLPIIVAGDLRPAPWPTSADWEDVLPVYLGIHAGLVFVGWSVLGVINRVAVARSAFHPGFIAYQRYEQPVFGMLWRLLVLVHLPLAAFSAVNLAHPWHTWLTLGSGLCVVAAAVLGQCVTLLFEARSDRWLASVPGDSVQRARTIGFLHAGRESLVASQRPEGQRSHDQGTPSQRTPSQRTQEIPASPPPSGVLEDERDVVLPPNNPDGAAQDLQTEATDEFGAAMRASAGAPLAASIHDDSLLRSPFNTEPTELNDDELAQDMPADDIAAYNPSDQHLGALKDELSDDSPEGPGDESSDDKWAVPLLRVVDGAYDTDLPATTLRLAHQLAHEGKYVRARALAREVEETGDPAQRAEAQRLLVTLPGRWRRLKFASAVASIAVIAVLSAFLWQVFVLPSGEETLELARSAHVHVRKDAEGIRLLGTRYDYSLNTSLGNIASDLVNAVVASEDHRFFEHGASYKLAKFAEAGVLCALRKINVFSSPRACAGNSTIGQQLARNLLLSEKRSIARKLVELVWAIKMEWSLSKETILELYLNRIYLGRGNFGVELAARSYFNKSAAKLDLYESALLAAAVKRPGWNWVDNRDGAMERARLILALMRRHGHAPADAAFPPRFAPRTGLRPPRKPYLGHLWQWIRPRVETVLTDRPNGDYKLLTSLNAEVEVYAERHLNTEVKRLSRAGVPVSQGAVVVMRTDGAVLAMVGGAGTDLTARGFNRAKRTVGLHSRPPASSFKPFVYLAGLEAGLTPQTVIEAGPVSIPMPAPQPPYEPRNHDGSVYDQVTMRDGLVNSINTAAVHLLHGPVGFERLFSVLDRLGVGTGTFPRQWGVALGAATVPLVEMVSAYGAFATGGIPVEPHAFLAVTTADGRIVWKRPGTRGRRQFKRRDISRLNLMLRDVVAEGTGRQAALKLPDTLEVAGKTGTGDGFTDAWFIGYTADVVIGVWLGNDRPRSMPRLYGGTGPARVFNRIARDLVQYTGVMRNDATLP